MPTVKIGGTDISVQFPDSMSREEIAGVMAKNKDVRQISHAWKVGAGRKHDPFGDPGASGEKTSKSKPATAPVRAAKPKPVKRHIAGHGEHLPAQKPADYSKMGEAQFGMELRGLFPHMPESSTPQEMYQTDAVYNKRKFTSADVRVLSEGRKRGLIKDTPETNAAAAWNMTETLKLRTKHTPTPAGQGGTIRAQKEPSRADKIMGGVNKVVGIPKGAVNVAKVYAERGIDKVLPGKNAPQSKGEKAFNQNFDKQNPAQKIWDAAGGSTYRYGHPEQEAARNAANDKQFHGLAGAGVNMGSEMLTDPLTAALAGANAVTGVPKLLRAGADAGFAGMQVAPMALHPEQIKNDPYASALSFAMAILAAHGAKSGLEGFREDRAANARTSNVGDRLKAAEKAKGKPQPAASHSETVKTPKRAAKIYDAPAEAQASHSETVKTPKRAAKIYDAPAEAQSAPAEAQSASAPTKAQSAPTKAEALDAQIAELDKKVRHLERTGGGKSHEEIKAIKAEIGQLRFKKMRLNYDVPEVQVGMTVTAKDGRQWKVTRSENAMGNFTAEHDSVRQKMHVGDIHSVTGTPKRAAKIYDAPADAQASHSETGHETAAERLAAAKAARERIAEAEAARERQKADEDAKSDQNEKGADPAPANVDAGAGGVPARSGNSPAERGVLKTAPPKPDAGSLAPNVRGGEMAHFSEIGVHPEMQHKKTGITDLVNNVGDTLKGTSTYDMAQGGTWTVFRDKDGKLSAVNSHHRRELANRADRFVRIGPDGKAVDVEPNVPLNVLDVRDGWTVSRARAYGALENIRDNKGSAIDAVDAMEEFHYTPADLAALGVSLNGELARNMMGLTRLNPSALARVRMGDVEEAAAAGVGSVEGLEPGTQDAALAEMADRGYGTYDKARKTALEYLADQKDGTLAKEMASQQSSMFDEYAPKVKSTRGLRVELKTLATNRLVTQYKNLLAPTSAKLRDGEHIDSAGRKHEALGMAESQAALKQRAEILYNHDWVKAEIARLAGEVGNGRLTKEAAANELAKRIAEHAGKSVKELADTSGQGLRSQGAAADGEAAKPAAKPEDLTTEQRDAKAARAKQVAIDDKVKAAHIAIANATTPAAVETAHAAAEKEIAGDERAQQRIDAMRSFRLEDLKQQEPAAPVVRMTEARKAEIEEANAKRIAGANAANEAIEKEKAQKAQAEKDAKTAELKASGARVVNLDAEVQKSADALTGTHGAKKAAAELTRLEKLGVDTETVRDLFDDYKGADAEDKQDAYDEFVAALKGTDATEVAAVENKPKPAAAPAPQKAQETAGGSSISRNAATLLGVHLPEGHPLEKLLDGKSASVKLTDAQAAEMRRMVDKEKINHAEVRGLYPDEYPQSSGKTAGAYLSKDAAQTRIDARLAKRTDKDGPQAMHSGADLETLMGGAEDLRDYGIIAAYHIAEGAATFAEWTKRMAAEFPKLTKDQLTGLYAYVGGKPDAPEPPKAEPKPDAPQVAAAPTKAEEKGPTTGGKNAVTEEERKARGAEEVVRQEKQTVSASHDAGRKLVESGSVDPRRLARDVADSPRPLSAAEVGALVYDRTRLYKAYNDLSAEMDAYIDPANGAKTATPEMRRAFAALDRDLAANDDALVRGGREQSAAFAARKMMAFVDAGDFAGMSQRARRVKGSDLTPKETETIKKATGEARKKDADYENQAVKSRERQAATKKTKAEKIVAQIDRTADRKSVRSDLKTQRTGLYEKLRKTIGTPYVGSDFGGQMMSEIAPIVGKLAHNLVLDGVTRLADIVDAIRAEVPELAENHIHDALIYVKNGKPASEITKTLRKLRKEARLISDAEDETDGKDTRPQTPPMRANDTEAQAGIRAWRDAQRNIRRTTAQIEEVKTRIAAGDMIAPTKPGGPRNTLEAQLAALKTQLADNRASERKTAELARNLALEKRGIDSRKVMQAVRGKTEEQASMQAQINALRKDGEIQKKIEGLKAQLASGQFDAPTRRSAAAKTAAQAQLAELQKQKAAVLTGQRTTENLKTKLAQEQAGTETRSGAKANAGTPEQSGLREQIALVRKQRDVQTKIRELEAQLKSGTLDEKTPAAQTAKTQAETRLAELQQQKQAILQERKTTAGLKDRLAREQAGQDTRAGGKGAKGTEQQQGLRKGIQRERTLRDVNADIAKYQQMLKDGNFKDYEKDKADRAAAREQKKADEELDGAARERDHARAQVENTIRSLESKTRLEKAVSYARTAKIASLPVYYKLFGASSWSLPVGAMEDMFGAGFGKLSAGGGKRLSDIAAREGQFSLKAEGAKARAMLFSKDARKNAMQMMKTGTNEIKSEIGAVTPDPGPLNAGNFTGRTHGAEKSFLQTGEYKKALFLRERRAAAQGLDVSDENVRAKMRTGAAVEAQNAILQGENLAAAEISAHFSKMRNSKHGSVHVAGAMLETLIPIVKTASNYVGKSIDATGVGVVRGAAMHRKALGEAKRSGVPMSAETADAILRAYKTGGVAAIAILAGTGAIPGVKFGGYYHTPKKGDAKNAVSDGEVEIGGVRLPHVVSHSPFLEACQFWATARQNYSAESRAHHSDAASVAGATGKAALGLLSQAPGVESVAEAGQLLTGKGNAGRSAGHLVAGDLVPGVVRNFAQWTDRDRHGKPVKRKERGFRDAIKAGIPVLRKQIPANPKGK